MPILFKESDQFDEGKDLEINNPISASFIDTSALLCPGSILVQNSPEPSTMADVSLQRQIFVTQPQTISIFPQDQALVDQSIPNNVTLTTLQNIEDFSFQF